MIVADDENLDVAAEFGFHTVGQDNLYLGRKFNDGMEFACRYLDADYVVLIGSDDWVHVDLFTHLPKPVADLPLPTPERPVVIGRPGPEAGTGKEIAMVNLARGVLQRCRVKGRFGVIPWVLPRAALEPSGFRPIREEQQRGIDGALLRGLKCRPEWVFSDPHPLCRVDFKSEVNLNSYDKITSGIGYGAELPAWSTLSNAYPTHLVDLARSTADRLGAIAA